MRLASPTRSAWLPDARAVGGAPRGGRVAHGPVAGHSRRDAVADATGRAARVDCYPVALDLFLFLPAGLLAHRGGDHGVEQHLLLLGEGLAVGVQASQELLDLRVGGYGCVRHFGL